MKKYWSNLARSITPYVPGEQPKNKKLIKLNTNENPYPPSPKAIEAMKNAVNEDLRRYPDPNFTEVREAAADFLGLKKEQIFAGNGSDEVLAIAYLAFFNPDNPILYPDITYSFYPVYCDLFNIKYELVPLNEDFSVPVEQFFRKNGGIIIANPNAPTSIALSKDDIRKILDNNKDSIVIIDEAYIDFGNESAIQLIDSYPNLLVVRTLSKSHSLAGLRVGLAMGNAELIEAMDAIKNSFNSYTMDRVAIAGASAALRDITYFEGCVKKIVSTRTWLTKELKGLGFIVPDSKSNFLFISHPKIPAKNIFEGLRSKDIIVRYFNKPKIDNYLRVTIGTDDEMKAFIEALKDLIYI